MMASPETEVVWKCGSCDECFYDLQILASHKCIAGSGGTVAISDSCIKQLEIHSYDDLSNSNEQVQSINNLNIIEGSGIGGIYGSASPEKKPTIISIKKKAEFKKHQKSKRSIVWTYFTALDDKKAMCCICQKVIAYCGTPTNLVYHLSRYHPKEGDVVKSKQASNIKYQYLSTKLPKSTPPVTKRKTKTVNLIRESQVIQSHETPTHFTVVNKKVNTTEGIIEMMIIDMLPVSVLQGSGFKKFVAAFDPNYKIPAPKEFFIDHIPKKYYSEYKRVQNSLKDVEKVHVSAEIWTGCNDQEFLTVSVHFVTTDFNYKHFALNTFSINAVNPENLMTNIVTSISQWDLSMDVMCIVNDGSDLMAKTSQLTGWKNVESFAHILDGIIKAAFASSKDLLALIEKCRKLATFLRTNESAQHQLLEAQIQEKNLKVQHAENPNTDINAAVDVKYPLKVKKDHQDEWISTFYMLQRIATLKNVLLKVLPNCEMYVDTLSTDDWTAIEETIGLLKAFEVVTLELCNEPFQFASKVIPVTLGLNSLINNCNNISHKMIEKVRSNILTSLRKRLGQVEHNLTLAMSTILDPRFKNIAFQSELAVNAALQQLTSEVDEVITDSNNTDTSPTETIVPSYTDSLWANFERKATPKKALTKSNDVIHCEIKNYLEEPLLDRKKNPFMWWKLHGQSQFPNLTKLAKKILCIPATSIPPERVFLKKGRVFSEKRKLIKPKYVDQFMFLNMNLE